MLQQWANSLDTEVRERQRHQEALRESEAHFRAMADTAPVMIWMSGVDKLCTFFNKGGLTLPVGRWSRNLGADGQKAFTPKT